MGLYDLGVDLKLEIQTIVTLVINVLKQSRWQILNQIRSKIVFFDKFENLESPSSYFAINPTEDLSHKH